MMKQLEEFTYLRSVIIITLLRYCYNCILVITGDGKFVQDIERGRREATRAFGMLRRRLWGRREN